MVERVDELQVERAPPSIEGSSERAERLANLLTLSYEPMLVWRLDGPIEFWNTGAERLYGFTADEAIGRDSHALLRDQISRWIGRPALKASEPRIDWSGELCHTCKDGHEVTVDSRMQLLGDGAVLEVNRDVSRPQTDPICA